MTVGDAAESGAAAFVETPFLGVRLARLDMQEAARVIAARPFGAPFAYVVTPNAQHFVLLDRGDDKRFSAAYANAWLRLCDSKVVCALARALFGEHLPHAAGSDLTAYLFGHFIQPEDRITVIGGDEELAARLRTQFRLTNLHHHNPPMGFINSPASDRPLHRIRAQPPGAICLSRGRCSFFGNSRAPDRGRARSDRHGAVYRQLAAVSRRDGEAGTQILPGGRAGMAASSDGGPDRTRGPRLHSILSADPAHAAGALQKALR